MSTSGGADRPFDPRIEILHRALDEVAKLLMAQAPALKHICADAIQAVFCPGVIGRQLAILVALEAGMVTLNQVTALVQAFASRFSSRSRSIRRLQMEQQQAESQDDWMELAEKIDRIQGNDVWRSDPACALYERDRISARIDEFVHLMRRQDLFELMFVLRGSIGRSKFGLLHEGLFSKALAGSKVLVETYHNVVCAALDYVCDAPVLPDEDPIPTEARLAFFNETRHSYGRTALLLSGGAALGFYHIGVVKTLMENRLMPRVLGGASAGSLVCAMVATRTDEELVNDLLQVKGTDAPGHSGKLMLDFFRPLHGNGNHDPSNPLVGAAGITELGRVYRNTAGGAFHDMKRTVQGLVPIPLRRFSAFLYDMLVGNRRPRDVFMHDTNHFRDCVRNNVGNFTFQEAFDRTGRILNIVVTPNNASDPPRLLNYLTAPHILVWSAAVASSSLPGVFEANRLVVKEADGWERYESGGDGQRFRDGSMEQDLPMQQLSEMFNVNHFIISQANPHAVMFASYHQDSSVWTNPVTGLVNSVIKFLRHQVRSWLEHLVQLVGARRFAPIFGTQRDMAVAILTQEYEGRRNTDISLIPWLNHRSLLSAMLHIVYNPSESEFREWIRAAERETWRHIPAIKSHIAEEVTLDRCVQRLRTRLLRESWERQAQVEAEKTLQENNKVGDRVPSFFTSSRSIVQLGGLAVSDHPPAVAVNAGAQDAAAVADQGGAAVAAGGGFAAPPKLIAEIDINSGWGGRGLRGNRSSGNLYRSTSEASGLFIDDEEHHQQGTAVAGGSHRQQQQEAGDERTEMPARKVPSFTRSGRGSDADLLSTGYVKTTSMAQFYYRKAGDCGDTQECSAPAIPKTKSDPVMDANGCSRVAANGGGGGSGENPRSPIKRKKSKSHADLVASRND